MTFEQLRDQTEKEIGDLSFDQCLVLRCIYEAYFNEEDPRENNNCKIER